MNSRSIPAVEGSDTSESGYIMLLLGKVRKSQRIEAEAALAEVGAGLQTEANQGEQRHGAKQQAKPGR